MKDVVVSDVTRDASWACRRHTSSRKTQWPGATNSCNARFEFLPSTVVVVERVMVVEGVVVVVEGVVVVVKGDHFCIRKSLEKKRKKNRIIFSIFKQEIFQWERYIGRKVLWSRSNTPQV